MTFSKMRTLPIWLGFCWLILLVVGWLQLLVVGWFYLVDFVDFVGCWLVVVWLLVVGWF